MALTGKIGASDNLVYRVSVMLFPGKLKGANQMTKVRVPETSTTPFRSISKFNGTCRHCGERYYASVDKVMWNPRQKGTVCHAGCYAAYGSPAATPYVPPVPFRNDPVDIDVTETTPVDDDILVLEDAVDVTKKTPTAHGDLFESFAKVMLPYIQDQIRTKVDASEVQTMVKDALDAFKSQFQRTIVVHRKPEDVKVDLGLVHESFEEALEAAKDGDHVYLYGPRGSGKSEMAAQIAKALGLAFYTLQLNQQTSESKIAGMKDAMGVIHSTPFIQAYKGGGTFYLSEADNAAGNFLTGLNTALSNGYYTTAWGETIYMHKDFRFIADGNTVGLGHDKTYSSRGKLDGATLDRWSFVHVPYDLKLERAIALGKNPNAGPWIDWVVKVRTYCATVDYTDISASPRASIKGAAKLINPKVTVAQAANQLVAKGVNVVDPAKWNKVLANCPLPEVKR